MFIAIMASTADPKPKNPQTHGLPTPDGTPAPEPSQRSAEPGHSEVSTSTVPSLAADGQGQTNPQAKPTVDHNKEATTSLTSATDDLTKRRQEEVKRILACGKDSYNDILSVKEDDSNQIVLKEWRSRGSLLHPHHCEADEDLKNAFSRS